MNFPEYRTLATRAKRDDRVPEDEFEENQFENPSWVRKYLDLADRAIQRSNDEEKYREPSRAILRIRREAS